ncbi:MAG: hypothetical protein ACKE51_05220 [Methylococcaceae bacterium]
MPYISRNEKGEIIEIHDSPVSNNDQWLEANHPDILTYLSGVEKTDQAMKALTNTDVEMVRVVEDVIDLLMKKQIFIFTELPEAVQTKLNARKQLREDMNSLGNLINDDDAIF